MVGTRAEFNDFFLRYRQGLVSRAEVIAAGVFLCTVSAVRRCSHRLAEDDALQGVAFLEEAGYAVPNDILVGHGHRLASRIADWVRANVPEAQEALT